MSDLRALAEKAVERGEALSSCREEADRAWAIVDLQQKRLDALEAVAEAARDVDEMWSGEDGEVIRWDPETSLALEDLRTALSGADRLDTVLP